MTTEEQEARAEIRNANRGINVTDQKKFDRLAEFNEFGISPKFGHVAGSFTLYATEAEKVLRLLRRLKKLERRQP